MEKRRKAFLGMTLVANSERVVRQLSFIMPIYLVGKGGFMKWLKT